MGMCMCWYPARGAPDQSFMLADARTPAVLADAPAAVKLADASAARAPAVLSKFSRSCGYAAMGLAARAM